MRLSLIAICISVSAHALADSTPVPGSPAPGKFQCQLTYDLFDPSAPARPAPSCPTCTMRDPQRSTVTPDSLKIISLFTYLYAGAKSAAGVASDSFLSLRAGAQVNADGYSVGTLAVSRNGADLVTIMAPVIGANIEVKIPGPQGMTYQGKIVQQIDATCWVQ